MSAKKLSGSDKAAVALLALGEDLAAALMARLPPAQARPVAGSLAHLGRVDATLAGEVLAEFQPLLAQGARNAGGVAGNADAARRILAAASRARGEDLGAGITDDGGAAL